MTAVTQAPTPVPPTATTLMPALPALPQAVPQTKPTARARRSPKAGSIRERLRRVATAASFAEFCQQLHRQGASLGVCSDPTWSNPEVAIVMEADVCALSEIGLSTDFAAMLERWDSRKYHDPLYPSEVKLTMARATYCRLSEWRSDLPRRCWPEVQTLLVSVVAEDVEGQIEDAYAGMAICSASPNSEQLARLHAAIARK